MTGHTSTASLYNQSTVRYVRVCISSQSANDARFVPLKFMNTQPLNKSRGFVNKDDHKTFNRLDLGSV